MKKAGRILMIAIAAAAAPAAAALYGQTNPETLKNLLAQPVQSPDVTAFQLQQYLSHRIPPLPSPQSANDWTEQQRQLRDHILNDIAFHGWPPEWVHSAPNFQQVGATESRAGYRVSKFRYEIVPGFDATALLYEPAKLDGPAPAILNLIGHHPMGEAAEDEQKRCINFAKRGIVALNLGWMGFGELALQGDAHDDAAALDLVGSNAFGLFYLSMRRGLDYLAELPEVDPARLGVTGLSGGGWQTVMLSAMDNRVAVSVEVAGIGALQSNITHPIDTDEIEEDATDLNQGEDYPLFVAMRAPRPTLLIHNAEDTCCFRAALVKPYIYDAVRPFFDLYRKPEAFAWYENTDPGTHNYQILNRVRAYTFFTANFHMPEVTAEIPSSLEVRTPEELAVGIPAGNLTIIGLARKLAGTNSRSSIPSEANARVKWAGIQREKLKEVLRYTPVSVKDAWRISNSRRMAIRTLSYRFDFANGLSAAGLWLKADDAGENAPVTVVMNDNGYQASGETVSRRVNQGQQVLALDLLFNGSMRPQIPDATDWELLVASVGDRPLGLEAAQLLGVAHWLSANHAGKAIEVETDGIRSAVIAAAAAAIDPGAFSIITSRHAMSSFSYLLDKPVAFRSAPDLFCLDLYKYFDIDSITDIAAPTTIRNLASIQETP